MIKIKMHAMYDHFPDRHPVDGEPYLDFYADSHIPNCPDAKKTNVAMLLEPKSMVPEPYQFVKRHPERFGLIFTHDSELLQLNNARPLNWADVWSTTDSEKTKGISIVSSWKNWCPLHIARLQLAIQYESDPRVDCFGSFRPGERDKWDDVKLAHEHYKFAIVLENDIDDLWFTEKILNCFANKVVPIYVGSPIIGYIFNPEGIIEVRDWKKVPEVVDELWAAGLDNEYSKRQQAIEDNFKRVERFKTPWKERFFNDYESLLEGLLK